MDEVKVFKTYLSRVIESANKTHDGHKRQLIRSSNELIDMYVESKQEAEDQIKWADTYFKELQQAKFNILMYEKALKEIAEFGGTDMLGKTCAKVAKEALQEEGRIILGNLEHIGKIPKKPRTWNAYFGEIPQLYILP